MNDKIKCPNCSHEFDVEEAISGQLRSQYKAEFELKVSEQADIFNSKRLELEKEKEAFLLKKEKENELFKKKLDEKILLEKEKITKATKENFELQLKNLQEENEERKMENRALKKREINLIKKENELQEKAEDLELELQKKMLEKQSEIEEKGRQKEREASILKEKEYEKRLDDQKKLIEEMRRKAEQGSMQLQGEVQELAIEQYLRDNFPFDEIEEIKKGARGGDCLQHVHDGFNRDCGIIYYESKRTKDFQPSWIEKFKNDMRVKGADIGVIVTQAMPKDMEIMGEKNGIWICNFEEFRGLSHVLRTTIIRISQERTGQENKGDKMVFLYDYLTSSEFRMQIEGIVEGFRQLKEDLEKEKNAMNRIWAQREKQLSKVILNTTGMYGSIKGIAGKAIGTIEYLELPGSEQVD